MTKVVVDMSMSLDGYIAGPNDSFGNGLGDGGMHLHDWLFSGSEPSPYSDFFRPEGRNARWPTNCSRRRASPTT
jgi:hypothetical protein